MSLVEVKDLVHIQNVGSQWKLWKEHDFSSELKNAQSRQFFIYDSQGFVNGFILYRVSADEAWIMNMAVRDKGQGDGVKLMSKFFIYLRTLEEDIRHVGLEVSAYNKSALKLYEKFQFKKVSVRKAYYSNGDDAWLMLRSFET